MCKFKYYLPQSGQVSGRATSREMIGENGKFELG